MLVASFLLRLRHPPFEVLLRLIELIHHRFPSLEQLAQRPLEAIQFLVGGQLIQILFLGDLFVEHVILSQQHLTSLLDEPLFCLGVLGQCLPEVLLGQHEKV